VIYLTGVTNDTDEPALIKAGIGLMAQPGNSYHLRIDRYPWWAADNGCFNDRWTEDPWMRWLEKLPRERCLFAVAPDVYADAQGSIDRGLPYMPIIRELGFPVALVAQDGAENLSLPWDEFDALFIGGEKKNPEWKTSAAAEKVARRARGHGKWVHMGRVNSLLRMERARAMGCNSVDGTFIKYRRRKRATDNDGDRDLRGAGELALSGEWLAANPMLPPFSTFEGHAHPIHREASR
jgi:hypothetical protein